MFTKKKKKEKKKKICLICLRESACLICLRDVYVICLTFIWSVPYKKITKQKQTRSNLPPISKPTPTTKTASMAANLAVPVNIELQTLIQKIHLRQKVGWKLKRSRAYVLQCVAVYVAVCCSVLQCVAVCCSVYCSVYEHICMYVYFADVNIHGHICVYIACIKMFYVYMYLYMYTHICIITHLFMFIFMCLTLYV